MKDTESRVKETGKTVAGNQLPESESVTASVSASTMVVLVNIHSLSRRFMLVLIVEYRKQFTSVDRRPKHPRSARHKDNGGESPQMTSLSVLCILLSSQSSPSH